MSSETPGPPRPVIPGFFPDPSITRIGDRFYLATSSFEYAPGVPLFASDDLVTWEHVGNVLDETRMVDLSRAGPSGGIFAPTLRWHDEHLWLITTNWSDDGGHIITHAPGPEGPWATPVRLPDLMGIDPDLAWDDENRCLMTYTSVSAWATGIHQVELDPFTGVVSSEPRPLWNGTGGKFPEGPHLYHIGEHWYLLLAEGGTERGHAVTIARGPSPQGPFTANPANPILTARGTDWPIQNTGHADLVERPDGTWAIVFHGIRPRGSSPEWHVLGRETFAADVKWVEGWPVIGDYLYAAGPDLPVVEEVDTTQVPRSWVAAQHQLAEVLTHDGAGWTLRAPGSTPVFAGRRQQHLYARVTATLTGTGRGGLSIRIDRRHALDLELTADAVSAQWSIGDVRHELGRQPADGPLTLEIHMVPSTEERFSTELGPDTVVAGVRTAAGFTELGRVDGRYLSTEVAGGMTGRLIGVFVVEGSIRIQAFRYTGSDDPAAMSAHVPPTA